LPIVSLLRVWEGERVANQLQFHVFSMGSGFDSRRIHYYINKSKWLDGLAATPEKLALAAPNLNEFAAPSAHCN